jgi:hypothetical protein
MPMPTATLEEPSFVVDEITDTVVNGCEILSLVVVVVVFVVVVVMSIVLGSSIDDEVGGRSKIVDFENCVAVAITTAFVDEVVVFDDVDFIAVVVDKDVGRAVALGVGGGEEEVGGFGRQFPFEDL